MSYAAKAGAPKIASLVARVVSRRGWAKRAARKSFKKVDRPRPVRAAARWIKLPDVMTEVLFLPDQPGLTAVSRLDRHLVDASRRWRAVAQAERERRLEVVLAAVYDMVLTEHDPRWSTAISSKRVLDMGRRTQQEVTELRQEAQRAREFGTEMELGERLAMVPAHHRESIRTRWRDSKQDTWRVLSAVTSIETNPQDVVQQWQAARPDWLSTAAVPARLVAADLAWAYGAPPLAAELYVAAARDGAPHAQHLAGRAALLLFDTEAEAGARAVIEEFRSLPLDPLFLAVAAVVDGDWTRVRETLAVWSPENPLERMLRFNLFQRLSLLGNGSDVIERTGLDAVIAAGTKELNGEHVPVVGLIVAKCLVLRAQRAESSHPYRDLSMARNLAVQARDERRAVRAPSADAVAVACEAALAAGNFDLVVTLGDATDGQANDREAQDPAVRELVVLARTVRGDDVGPILPADATSAFAAARLRAAAAERAGQDRIPAWRQALAAADEDDQRITALAGLARAGASDLPGLEEISLRYPDQGREIRALADIAQGRGDQAIRSLRSLATTSMNAAMTLASAYRQAGDLQAEVEILRSASDNFHDPQFRLAAAFALAREGDRAGARAEITQLLTSAPADWPEFADAQRMGAQLALDDGDLLTGGELLRAALETSPEDPATRWALVRVLLARSDYPAAWRVHQEHPAPLEPLTADDALAWIEIHREHAPGQDTVRGCLRIMRQFADSEKIRAAAITAVIGPGTSRDPLPDDLLEQFHAATAEFIETWPDSSRLVSVPVPEDPTVLLEMMGRFVRTTPEQQELRRELTTKIVLGELPLGVLAAAVRRSYAEIVLNRGLDVIPARHPDPAEHAACLKTARQALDGSVVIDTTALVVTRVLEPDHRTAILGLFRLVTVDDVLADARAARHALSGQTVGQLTWDERAQAPRLVENDEAQTAALSAAAAALVTDIEHIQRLPRPAAGNPRSQDAFFSPWFPLIDLARSQGTALWSDDTALRALARAEGVPALSTPAVLQLLVEQGVLSDGQRQENERRLIRERVGDLPLLSRPELMMELAEEEHWLPGSVAVALGRPAVWTDHQHTTDVLLPLLKAIVANAPRTLPIWTYRLVRGAAYAHRNQPTTAHLVIGNLLAVIAHVSGAQSSGAATLIAACREALHDSGYGDTGAQDPVVTAALLMYRAYRRIFPPSTAAPYMLGFAADLDAEDRDAIARIVLTDRDS